MNLFLHFLKIEDSFIDIIITFLKNHPTFKNLIISLFTVFITLLGREIPILWRKNKSIKRKREVYIKILKKTKEDIISLLNHSQDFEPYLDKVINLKKTEKFIFKKYSFEKLDLFNFYNSEDLFLICKKESDTVLKIFELNSKLSIIKTQTPWKINIDLEKFYDENINNHHYFGKQEIFKDDRKEFQQKEFIHKITQYKNRMNSLKIRNNLSKNNINKSIELLNVILENLNKNF